MDVIETVAEEAVVEVAKHFPPVVALMGGVLAGAAAGFWYGKRWNTEKIRALAFEESQVEVEEMRKVYLQKTMAAEPKPSVETIMKDKGYSNAEIARQTGQGEKAVRESLRPLPSPVPIHEELVKDGEWDYAIEHQNRSSDEPYVIHQDEHSQGIDGYTQVTYTYWARDDVLCGEDERPIPNGDLIVGETNLKFGHGTDDPEVVYIRNETLQLDIEICRTDRSYEQDVLGLQDDEGS